ncbi:MAG: hypothetical protein NXH75_00760 [Halobacteriovoraceae bacterium]|nr:hypothetical protein [Halobacteriovoraceae bacterium]
MKFILLLGFLFSLSTQAKIYDSFMCYTQVDMVVMFGILKNPGTMRINYHRLDKNPTTIELKVKRYDRSDRSIIASGIHNGKEVISINSKGGFGTANINLMPFPGSEDVSFENEGVLCYFGKFEE